MRQIHEGVEESLQYLFPHKIGASGGIDHRYNDLNGKEVKQELGRVKLAWNSYPDVILGVVKSIVGSLEYNMVGSYPLDFYGLSKAWYGAGWRWPLLGYGQVTRCRA